MTKLFFSATLVTFAFASVSCERHSWEETQVLHQHHGAHDEHGHGHEGHKEGHEKGHKDTSHGDPHKEGAAASGPTEKPQAKTPEEAPKESRNLGL